jgi:hypothetical protein
LQKYQSREEKDKKRPFGKKIVEYKQGHQKTESDHETVKRATMVGILNVCPIINKSFLPSKSVKL